MCMNIAITFVSSKSIVVPNGPARTMYLAAPVDRPVERIVVNLAFAAASLHSALSAMSAGSCIRKIIVARDVTTADRGVDNAAGLTGTSPAANGVILDKPKLFRAVVWEICPGTVAVCMTTPEIVKDRMG